LTVLARGGYATVYRAVQESVGRDVAVKVENRTLESDRDQRRFLREARAAGRMSSHPHVVDLFDAGVTSDGHPYLIMELCDGSYAERMKSAPLSPAEAREVGFKIADALADAHSLGVLHRDVKPANILYSRFGEPALADFGLAILAEWRDVSITLDVLTPAYAPPESFRQVEPAPTADVYALCATLYALMRGRPPRWREGQPPSMVSLVDMFAQPIPDLPGVPGEMMELLRHGMANDAADRPTAMQLRDALMALRIEPAPAPPVLPPVSDYVPDYLNDETEPQGPTIPQGPTMVHRVVPNRRNRLWALLAAGAAALLTFLIVMVVYASGTGATTAYVFKTPAHSSPSASPSPSTNGVDCGPGVPGDATCIAGAECYDTAKKSIDCDGRHTWEAFAFATLPDGVSPADAGQNRRVRQVCSRTTLLLVDPSTVTGQWRIDVLVSTSNADRTYRCLAGKGPNALSGPQLRKTR
jgi:serine/threonine protein kinase